MTYEEYREQERQETKEWFLTLIKKFREEHINPNIFTQLFVILTSVFQSLNQLYCSNDFPNTF